MVAWNCHLKVHPDTMVDIFLQKLPPAATRFTNSFKYFYQLQPEMLQRIYDGKFVTQLRAPIWEEISDIKEEGNLEAVMNGSDKSTGKYLGDPVESYSTLLPAALNTLSASYRIGGDQAPGAG